MRPNMPMRSRLVRISFMAAAASLLLTAIIVDDGILPLALTLMFATLAYEAAYQVAIRMQDIGENGATTPV